MRLCAVLLLCFGLALPALAEDAALLDEDDVAVSYKDGRYEARFAFDIGVPPAVALAVLTDFERMPEFVPNLKSSRVLAREGPRWRIAQEGEVRFGFFRLSFDSVRQIELTQDGRLLSRTLSSSAGNSSSEMRVLAAPGGARLEYRLEVTPVNWIPSGLGQAMMRHELAEQFNAIGREMLRRRPAR